LTPVLGMNESTMCLQDCKQLPSLWPGNCMLSKQPGQCRRAASIGRISSCTCRIGHHRRFSPHQASLTPRCRAAYWTETRTKNLPEIMRFPYIIHICPVRKLLPNNNLGAGPAATGPRRHFFWGIGRPHLVDGGVLQYTVTWLDMVMIECSNPDPPDIPISRGSYHN